MLKRIIILFLIMLFPVAFGYFWCYQAMSRQECPEAVQPVGYVASDRTKAAMKYHGILFAESDVHGELWFIRDGRKCKVFTKACLKAIEENWYTKRKKGCVMKVTQLEAVSSEEARKLMAELHTEKYREGDRAEVTFPDGSKQVYVFKEQWTAEETDNYTIKRKKG